MHARRGNMLGAGRAPVRPEEGLRPPPVGPASGQKGRGGEAARLGEPSGSARIEDTLA